MCPGLLPRPVYVRKCIVGKGEDYRGKVSKTQSGRTCQQWWSKFPHDHRWTPSSTNGLELNYCRNPDGDRIGPWCYTTDPERRYESCSIPQCKDEVCITCNGEDYRGQVDHTVNGRECQRWDQQYPHQHIYQPEKYRAPVPPHTLVTLYPDKSLDDNYCRNPDASPVPWCYTTDPEVERESCDIRKCSGVTKRRLRSSYTTNCFRGRGEEYRGKVNETTSGIPCQRWDAQYPHEHPFYPNIYECKGLVENYCRNPDGSEAPWCFTSVPEMRTALCLQIKRCADDIEAEDCYQENGKNYKGVVRKTRKGILCQKWSANTPHQTKINPKTHPEANLTENYCRNPDGDLHGPWCYTTDPKTEFDYCAIKQCGKTSTRTLWSFFPVCLTLLTLAVQGGQGRKRPSWSRQVSPWSSLAAPLFPTQLLCSPPGSSVPHLPPLFPTQLLSSPPSSSLPHPAPLFPTRLLCSPPGSSAPHPPPLFPTRLLCSPPASSVPHPPPLFPTRLLCSPPGSSVPHPAPLFPTRLLSSPPGSSLPHPAPLFPTRLLSSPPGSSVPHPAPLFPTRLLCSPPGSSAPVVYYGVPCGTMWKGKHFCGGSLVNSKWVISTKQCFSSCYVDLTGYAALMGTLFRDPKDGEPNKQTIALNKIVCGPTESHLVLLQLETPAVFNERVSQICLPPERYIVPEGTVCEIAGWGETKGTGDESVLNVAQMQVQSNAECNKYFKGRVRENEMCTTPFYGGVGACERDYGGPLACQNSDCWVLEGVIIPMRRCGHPGQPNIFIRVSLYVDWIKKVMEMA
ncbi:hypothetical protein NFI96_007593 [Prochilodus magdalenae]|nr:hypothetical protein NFI96_007593 [Prochilodus magdalenae]